MPCKPRPEDTLIKLFLSAYDSDSWQGCAIRWLDQEADGQVEVLATRADDVTPAIEQTLIEFFDGEREDLERFKHSGILEIELDESLSLPGRIIYVDVPRGVFQKKQPWRLIADGVHQWLRGNIQHLPEGRSQQTCEVAVAADKTVELVLQTRVILDPTFEGKPPLVRRYGEVNLPETVEKALKAKLPKLIRTSANKRLLLLERHQWTLDQREIHAEIERRRTDFPQLAIVDQVWSVETVGASEGGLRGYVEFSRYEGPTRVESIAFYNGALQSRSRDGMPLPVAKRVDPA